MNKPTVPEIQGYSLYNLCSNFFRTKAMDTYRIFSNFFGTTTEVYSKDASLTIPKIVDLNESELSILEGILTKLRGIGGSNKESPSYVISELPLEADDFSKLDHCPVGKQIYISRKNEIDDLIKIIELNNDSERVEEASNNLFQIFYRGYEHSNLVNLGNALKNYDDYRDNIGFPSESITDIEFNGFNLFNLLLLGEINKLYVSSEDLSEITQLLDMLYQLRATVTKRISVYNN